jgi:MFS family permease
MACRPLVSTIFKTRYAFQIPRLKRDIYSRQWVPARLRSSSLLYVASGITSVGMFLMIFTTNLGALYGIGAVVGAGIGLFLSSNWALANQLAPPDQAGRFLGLTNLATAGSAALARLQGPAVDFLNGLQPDAWIGYKGVFLFGGICIAASGWLLRKVR